MASYSNPGVYVVETPLATNVRRANTSQSVATFIGTAPRGPVGATIINSWTGFRSLYGDVTLDHEMGYSVYHYFANGGRDAYIVRVTSDTAVSASTTVGYYPTGDSSGASTPLFTVTASSPGTWGNDLRVNVSSGVTAPSATQVPTLNLSVLLNGVEVERWNEVSTDPGNNRFLDTIVNTYSKLITVASTNVSPSADWLFETSTNALSGGLNGDAIDDNDYVSALTALDVIEGALLINAPGRTSTNLVNQLLAKAEARGNSFVIIDPSDETDPVEIGSTIVSTYAQSSYGAVYYPKLKMVDPTKTGPGAIRDSYPGGAVLGVYTRTEVARTVAKAPAGFEADVRNALGLVANYTSVETGNLYDTYGVNMFKAIPGGGIIINGTRTLDKRSPGKYVPIRRSLNFLKQSLKDATSFALFAPNDQRLWENLRYRCGVVLEGFWQAGGLKGATPDAAYYIVCDDTNNTPETINNGEVRIEVGVALQYPAEFVVITISQWTGGASSVNSL